MEESGWKIIEEKMGYTRPMPIQSKNTTNKTSQRAIVFFIKPQKRVLLSLKTEKNPLKYLDGL